MIVLASSSSIRRQMLERAGLDVEVHPARVDEGAMRDALVADGASPRDIADALAEAKARKVAGRFPDRVVIGSDQTLDLDGACLSKPDTRADAAAQLRTLSGRTHALHSAAVAYADGAPVWRHVSTARMHMRALTDAFIEDYLSRNWESVRHSVGGYKIEEEGARLFRAIEGDGFTIQGLPLVPLLSWLSDRGTLPA